MIKDLSIKKYKNLFIGLVIGISLGISYSKFYSVSSNWRGFETQTENIQLCFTPPSGCEDFIANYLRQSQESIYLQAYGFTSHVIIDELIAASKRGVMVKALLDRSNFSAKKSVVEDLRSARVEVIRDKVPGIAHNKVIILDNVVTITGSYNFTEAASKRNAENVIAIQDKKIAREYLDNWLMREEISR